MNVDSLRDYQKDKANEVHRLFKKYNLCYLIGQQRTGKTRIALAVTHHNLKDSEYALFITRKKAIKSIQEDYVGLDCYKRIEVINYEQLEKFIATAKSKPAIVVLDEAHCLGSFPKPSKKAKIIKKSLKGARFLLLSGTPTPESFTQIFHQFWCTGWGPWTRFKSFYKWAKEFVNVEKMYIGMGRQINNYKNAKPEVQQTMEKFSVTLTRKEAGFSGVVKNVVHTIELPDECRQLIRKLIKDNIDTKRNIIADTAAKLMQSIHQISSGTYIDSDGNRNVISKFKIDYIKERFKGKKIAIFYVYIAEGEILKKAFKNWTNSPEEFNKSKNKTFICQVVSGKEGTNLSSADELVFFNIGYSATCYWQARDRTITIDSGDRRVHWIFSDDGIERDVYSTVRGKENFTTKHFETRKFNSI